MAGRRTDEQYLDNTISPKEKYVKNKNKRTSANQNE
jgi:hypothetical protein